MGSKRNNLRPISEVLCYQDMSKIMNIEFPMSRTTKSSETSTEKLCMVSEVLLDTPKPFQFQPRLPFAICYSEVVVFAVFQVSWVFLDLLAGSRGGAGCGWVCVCVLNDQRTVQADRNLNKADRARQFPEG